MKIYKNVKIGTDPKIEDFCKIGFDDESKIFIGNNLLLRTNTVIYPDNIIGNNFSTGHNVVLREKNNIGNNVKIGTNSVIEGHCSIEDDVIIHSSCYIGEKTIIKKNAWIGPGTKTMNTKYPKHKYREWESPVIGENSVIGSGSIILPGIKIGDNSMIGAGSVVTKDIPSNTLAYGNPAKLVKNVTDIIIKGKKYER